MIVKKERWVWGKNIEGVQYKKNNIGAIVQVYMETLQGILDVSPGDWIVTDDNGNKYPCKSELLNERN